MAQGLANAYGVQGAYQSLDQLLAQRMQERQMAELERKNRADEALRAQTIALGGRNQDLLEKYRQDQLNEKAQNDQVAQDVHLGDVTPPGTPLGPQNPRLLAGMIRIGQAADKGIPEPAPPDALAANPNAAPSEMPGTIAGSPAPMGNLGGRLMTKLPSEKQNEAASKAKAAEADQARKDWEASIKQELADLRAGQSPNNHFSFMPSYDAEGKPNGVFRGNTTTGEGSTMPGAPAIRPTPPAPGAAQLAVKEKAKADARDTLTRLDKDIDVAASKGLIGPSAGRISDLEKYIGNPDPALSTLATRFVAAKMQVDAGLGGMRAAGSAQLLKRWDDLLNTHMTPENLHAVSKVLQEMVGGGSPSASSGVKVLSITPVK